jgi:FlaA1/EpsC-like NDP-sugar epimerase
MLGARYVAFTARLRARPAAPSAVPIIVFGAGEAGAQLIHRLATQPGAAYRPVAILDDDPDKRRLRIAGVPVAGDRTRLAEVAARTGARVLVIAIARPSGGVIRDLTATAERCGLVPKVIPSVRELLTGGARIEGVRDPRISDLLGRRPVSTDVAAVGGLVAGRRVLVTGAGGSIGSELCRQLHRFAPAELIMLDRDESALHAVQLALSGRALLESDETVLADIRDPRRVREVFERFRPQIVFHAAALKHLPLLENSPAEALKSNVRGTLTVLEAAAACGVTSFVNISTDKAASPASVLGYSKRIAERLTAQLAARTGAAYLSVRFGNVLGSRGSVLTALSAQVAAGGPVTVTHPDVSRYFMTADEAVQLVLQAAAIGRGGEVLVLDMGEPVRIADIARRLASGGDRDVEIVFTGLRPGEKLAEDLLGPGETDSRPCHPLISQVPVPPLDPAEVTALDPEADTAKLRQELAACAAARTAAAGIPAALTGPDAGAVAGQHATALAVQDTAASLAAGAPRPARSLGAGPGMSPAQRHEPGHQLVQEGGGARVPGRRPARRVGHVVIAGVAEQPAALAAGVSSREPAGQRLARLPRPDLLAPPDQFLQREGARPGSRQGDHCMPHVQPGHAEHEPGSGQVGGGDHPAAVPAVAQAALGHHRGNLRQHRVAVAEHPGRADRDPRAHRGQPAGEHRRRERRPAHVGRAQHQDAGIARAVSFRHCLCRPARSADLDITGNDRPVLSGKSFPAPRAAARRRRRIGGPGHPRHARRPGRGISSQALPCQVLPRLIARRQVPHGAREIDPGPRTYPGMLPGAGRHFRPHEFTYTHSALCAPGGRRVSGSSGRGRQSAANRGGNS